MKPPEHAARDRLLLTPGPLTTHATVRNAMLRDMGSRDPEFIAIIREIREGLLEVAGVGPGGEFEAVLMQGSGTFAIEAVISSVVPSTGKLAVLVNGAYGDRMVQIARRHRIDTVVVRAPENEPMDVDDVDRLLRDDDAVTHVAIVHCETTSGVMNPVQAVGEVVHRHGKCYVVDSMSAFGAVPIDMDGSRVDVLVASANKCLEGVPGFAFAICRRATLEASRETARTVSLDLHAQWTGLESNVQFRFTPPTHVLMAFRAALGAWRAEGGVDGRAGRYQANHAALVQGMRQLGFEEYVPPEHQGYIITSFLYPRDPNFRFSSFYDSLRDRGFVIYPGKLTGVDCFRIGNIGQVFPADIEDLIGAVREVLAEMGVRNGRVAYEA